MCDVSAVKTAPITSATNTAGATGGGDAAAATAPDLAAIVPALQAVVTALNAVIQALGGVSALGGGAGGAPTAPAEDAKAGSTTQAPPTQTPPPTGTTPPEKAPEPTQETPPTQATPPATPPKATPPTPPTQAKPPATPPVQNVPTPPDPPTTNGGGAEAAPKAPGLTVAEVQRQTEQVELDRLTGIAAQKREAWSTLRDQINEQRETITKLQGAGAPSYAIQSLQTQYDDMVVRQSANTDALQAADTDVKNYRAAHGF